MTGTIAQRTNNGYGVTGLAYGVKIMPLRVLDSQGNGDGANIARAIRFAVKHRAKVINMSVEFDTSLRAGDIPEVISALHYAAKKRVTLVAASGNEGISKVAYPARDPEVISVGATTFDGCLADYSNAGRGLDIVAPGGGQDAASRATTSDRVNCNPAGADHEIVQQTLWHDVRHFKLIGFEGTSFATPHVSAAAALLIATKRLGANPTPQQIRDRLKATARDLGAPGNDPYYGAGLLDVGAALAPDPAPTTGDGTSGGQPSSLGRSNDHHRAGSVVRHLVRHGAQQEPLRAGHPLVADDDQVRLLLLGHVEDRVGRVALTSERSRRRRRRPPPSRRPPSESRPRPRAR